MAVTAALANLVAELGAAVGLPGLALDRDGRCALAFDGTLTVDLRHRAEEDDILVFADLGAPAAGTDTYRELLRGNHFWSGTLGGTLCLTGDAEPRVVLVRPIDWRGLDGARLAGMLDTFVNTARFWREVTADRGDGEAVTMVAPPREGAHYIRV